MSTRRYRPYSAPQFAPFQNGSWVRGPDDSKPVNAAIVSYAETRRNVLAITANTGSVVPLVHHDYENEEDNFVSFTSIPIDKRVLFNAQATDNKLKVFIRYHLNVDGIGANKCYMRAYLGASHAEVELTSAAATGAWAEATIDFEDRDVEHGQLHIHFRTDGANTVNIWTISHFQPGDSGAPAWVDISGANCKLGTEDWPHSAMSMKLLTDAVKAVRGNRTVKSNAFNHWYRDYAKTGNAYKNNDELGRYKFVKREGVSQMILHCCMHSDDENNDFTLRAEIVCPGNAIAAQTLDYSAGADPMWDSFTFTFTGDDVAAEVECELLLDAKDNGYGMTMYLPGRCLVEKHLDAAVAHTVPDTDNTRSGTVQGVSEWDNKKNTLVNLWKGGGMAIALSDWCFGLGVLGYSERLLLDAAAADKSDHGSSGSIAARAICFPSTGSSRLRLSMGYITTAGEAQTKTIEFQLSDSMVDATYDEIGPGPDRAIEFLEANEENIRVASCEFDIASADWETPPGELGPADVPLQLWMFAYTTNPAEYVKPVWLTIEEITLGEGEFP